MNKKGKKTLGIHLGFGLGEAVCILTLMSSNTSLSRAYVAQQPLLVACIVHWWRSPPKNGNGSTPTTLGLVDAPRWLSDIFLRLSIKSYSAVTDRRKQTNEHALVET